MSVEKRVLVGVFVLVFVGSNAMGFVVVVLFFVRFVLVVLFLRVGCRGSVEVSVLRILALCGRVGGRFLVLLLLRFVG